MKRVVLLTNDFPPMGGGIANFLHSICQQLPSRSLVLTVQHANSYLFDAQQNYEIDRYTLDNSSLLQRNIFLPLLWVVGIWKLQKRNQLGCVVGGFGSVNILVALAISKLLFRCHTKIILHGADAKKRLDSNRIFGNKLIHWLFSKVDVFVANSTFTKNYIQEKLGSSNERVKVLNPGIDASRFVDEIDSGELNNPKRLLTVGRLVPHKGHATVLKAIAKLRNHGVTVSYDIVGTGVEEKNLKNLTKDLGLEEQVNFLGFVSDEELPSYYKRCDVFVMLSYEDASGSIEGFGIVFLEAGAAAKPVLGSRSGGIGDAVEEHKSGLLVDPHNIDEVSESIKRLIQDTKFADQLGNYARDRVINEFDWKGRSSQVVKLFNCA